MRSTAKIPSMSKAPRSEPPSECDVVVVGAGIVGLATARELTRRHAGIRVAVLEREDRIAAHQTGHSSRVVHTGIAYAPGSLRARLCVEGARELCAYCERHGLPAKRTGKLIVATRPSELPRLSELERRGRANGVEGLERLGAAEIAEHEPHARGLAALRSPQTGLVDFAAVAASFLAELAAAGGTLTTSCPVHALRDFPTRLRVEHARGETRARAAVACAGAWADRLARAAGAGADPRIVPFRGAYLRLRPERAHLVRASLYPVPDPRLPFLGAHLTRGLDGSVLLGPTALLVGARDAYRASRVRPRDLAETLAWPGTWRLARRHRRAALRELRHALDRRSLVAEVARLVPELRVEDLVAGPAGVRAQALARDGTLVDDFALSRTARAVHVRNAPSPAATAVLPLARLIADELEPLL